MEATYDQQFNNFTLKISRQVEFFSKAFFLFVSNNYKSSSIVDLENGHGAET